MRSHSQRGGRRALVGLAATAVVASVFGPLTSDVQAAVETFDNGGGDLLWSNAANWDPDGPVDGNDAKFGATGASTSAATVTSIVDANRSVLSLGFNQSATSGGANSHTVQINDGFTLTINGSTGANGSAFYVGNGINNSLPSSVNNLTFANFVDQPGAVTGGTLAVNNALADLHVRQTGSATGNRMATLNLFGLSHFNATMRNINVGVGDAADTNLNRGQGTLFLAKNNTINASSVNVGVNVNNGTTANPSARLFFGNTNTLNVGSITIGGMQTPNNSAGFNSAVAGGSLVVRGIGGIGRADLAIGAQQVAVTSATSTTANVVDFNGGSGFGSGSVDMMLGNVVLGRAGFTSSGAGTARNAAGTLTYAAGVINADSVTLGDDNATANAAIGTGTLNVNGAGQLVVNNSLTLGRKTNAGGAVGTLNIDGATASARVAGSGITDGGGTSTLNVANGATLQSRGLGSASSRIDTVNVTGGNVLIDIGNTVPVTAWGHVGTLNANGANTIGLRFSGALTPGTFPGINYTSIGGTGFGSFTMAKQPARVTAHLVDNPNSIDISIDSVDTPKWAGELSNGTDTSTWDVTTTNNWKLVNAGTFTNYQEDLVTYSTTDSVLFDDSATGTTTVDVSTTVAPNAVNVNNSALPYTFSGSGKITGSAAITKTGTGTLTIANTGGNDFAGGVIVQGGTVNTGASNVLPDSGSISASAGGTFDLQSHTETVGTVTVTGGAVTAGNGSLVVGIVNLAGGSVSTGTGVISAGAVNIDGGTLGGTGAITVSNSINALQGTISTNVGGTTTLTKNGAGTLNVSGANTYTGITTLNEGTLAISHNDALGSAAARTLISGPGATTTGVLALSGGISVPEPLELGGRRGTSSVSPNFNPHIINAAGDNTLSGNLNLVTNGTLYTLQSDAGKLTVSGGISTTILSTGNNRELFLRGAANGEVSGNITNPAGTDPIVVTKRDAGTWTLSGANTYAGGTVVTEGTLIAAHGDAFAGGALSVATGATAVAQAGLPKGLTVASVTTAGTGKLDLTNNDLVVKSTTVAAVQASLLSGFNGGTWDGPGIQSSAAATDPNGFTALGYLSNADLGATEFSGVPVDADDILVKYTYYGDADLSGNVTLDDYSQFLFGFQNPVAASWSVGDFDYSGTVTLDDFSVFLLVFQNQGGPLGGLAEAITADTGLSEGSRAAMLGAIAAVPEPATLGVLALAGMGLMGRRRTRRV